ncbi:hypothetical protein Q7P35_011531 [Cladosporium inversicolor]
MFFTAILGSSPAACQQSALPSRDTNTEIDANDVSFCIVGTRLVDTPGTRVFAIQLCMFRQPSDTLEKKTNVYPDHPRLPQDTAIVAFCDQF